MSKNVVASAELEKVGDKRPLDGACDEDHSPASADDSDESASVEHESEPKLDGSDAEPGTKSKRPTRSISISVRGLLVALLMVALTGALGCVTWMYFGARSQLDAQASAASADAKVEKIALDYAVNAATMDFNNLQEWKVKLVEGTGQELGDKLTKAANSMEQILVPLQWTSTAKPLVAKVRSSAAGVYVVDCFVAVETKTVQSPDGLQSTATYSVTIDQHQGWKIVDVGGIGAAVERK